jgi:hypothetical protein
MTALPPSLPPFSFLYCTTRSRKVLAQVPVARFILSHSVAGLFHRVDRCPNSVYFGKCWMALFSQCQVKSHHQTSMTHRSNPKYFHIYQPLDRSQRRNSPLPPASASAAAAGSCSVEANRGRTDEFFSFSVCRCCRRQRCPPPSAHRKGIHSFDLATIISVSTLKYHRAAALPATG